MRRPTLVAGLVLCSVCLVLGTASQAQPPDAKGKPLFNGVNFNGWYKYSGDKKIDREDIIYMDGFEKFIVMKGASPGYLITEVKYRDYQLNFEWRWSLDKENTKRDPDKRVRRRSGVLFHIDSEGDSIWPKSIQAVLDYEHAGDLRLMSGYALDVNPERKDREAKDLFHRSHDGVEKPVGDWNQGTITCHGKFVSISINGVMVMAGRNASVSNGRIALICDAGEVHFRNILMKRLEGKPVDPEKDD